jgi:tetratricopeptide (TPR) repeat protein
MASASPAEAVPGKETEWLRIYCSTHNLGFAAARAPRIKCESGGHELDQGFPRAALWEYCCDCQHYWLLDANKVVAELECPACERKISRRFFCDQCQVIAIESDNPGRRKVYSIAVQGSVSPVCPGCLIPPPAVTLDHDCPDFGGLFVTPRTVCPFCDDVLDPPPSFPSAVSSYLEKLHQPLVKLEFDPASNVLRESQSGDYILIEKVRGSVLPIVIPRAPRLSSKQDYYSTYFELFNCDNPAPGEVVVLSPAIVEKTENGWQLREAGFIDIKPDNSTESAVTGQVRVPCAACGEPGEIGHAFCRRCGSPMLGQRDLPISPESSAAAEQYSAEAPAADYPDTLSVGGGAASIDAEFTPAGFPWNGLLVGGGVLAVVVILIAIAGLSRNGLLPGAELSVEQKLDRSIAAGNLFGPANENAHDLYSTLKNSGANDEVLRRYREKLTPLLTSHPYQLLSGLMQIGYDEPDATEWQEAAKSLGWAEELNPGNGSIAARAAYCKGRTAYLQKDLDGALKWWTNAADLDRSWVLPVNGVGMVHTGNRNWAAARTFFFQALQRDANWPFPEENIGNTYVSEKNLSAAKEFYQKAVGKAPNWAKPHVHLAYIALTEKDFATAVSEFETALGPNAVGLKGDESANTQKSLEKARQKLSEAQGY